MGKTTNSALAAMMLLVLAGCTSLHSDQLVQQGRIALISGRPNDAIETFRRVAADDPKYKTSYAISESVWTYLGRAYYETGNYSEARSALDKALALDNNDAMARLYRGMTLTRINDRERGLTEMQTSLKRIYQWLEELPADNPAGNFWDPGRQIRKLIESGLAGNPNAIELVVTAQRVGKLLEEEIDRDRRDRVRASMRY